MELSGRFGYGIQGSSAFSPDDAFDIAECEYRDDFLEWWGLEASEPPDDMEREAWLECRRLYGLARQIAEAARTLLRRKGLGSGTLAFPRQLEQEAKDRQRAIDRLVEQTKDLVVTSDHWKLWDALRPRSPDDPRTKHHVFQNALQLEALRLFPYSPKSVADRLAKLTGFLVQRSNARTSAYLARVAQCFALDLRTELAAMARTVLDTALQDYIDDEEVCRKVGVDRHVTMARRLEYCRAEGILVGEDDEAARLIKQAGDDAVHTAPDLAPDPELLLEKLATVLSRLDDRFGSR